MTQMLTAHGPVHRSLVPAAARPRLSPREDLLTVAFGAWLILGLFVDGWAHNADKPETFFTPWHALFYSGFAATAVWMLSRYHRHGAVPAGYGLGLIGVFAFAAGGVADMVWHEIFGIEVDLEALVSPSHLLLFGSALLILSSPLRAAWSDTGDGEPSLRRLLPVIVSTTLVTAMVTFFLMPFSPFLSNVATKTPYRFVERAFSPGTAEWFTEELQLEGFASILLTTLVLMAPTLHLLRRWRLPFGSLTILFTTVVVLASAIEGFRMPETLLAGVVAGVGADMLVRALHRREVSMVAGLRIVAAAVPALLWFTYFGVLAVFYSVGWPVDMWAGITVMASLGSLGLALLMTPAAVPTGGGYVASHGDAR